MSVTSSNPAYRSPNVRVASRPTGRAKDPGHRENWAAAWLVVALVVMLALNGLNTAYSAFTAPAAPHSIGQAIATTFGFIRVNAVETVGGLTASDLGGMTHNVPGLVDADHARMRVTVTLDNASNSPVPVRPDHFRLVVDGDAANALPPSGATITAVSLPAGSTLDASVMFVVPRRDAEVELRYAPSAGETVGVPAGRIDASAPGNAGQQHP